MGIVEETMLKERPVCGRAITLLHGFPEDCYEFRLVMPRLAKMFTVVALDLRGVGESASSGNGYEARQAIMNR
jgi:pimeloyl-ACP methyl ester carboxylesterase